MKKAMYVQPDISILQSGGEDVISTSGYTLKEPGYGDEYSINDLSNKN